MKVVAIHQPTFFPWLGFFDKLARADEFILMDNAQFPKKGGRVENRMQLIVSGEPQWVTMPVVRSFHGTRLNGEMLIDNSQHWRMDLLKTIQMNYAHAGFFEAVFPVIVELVMNPTDRLVDYNEAAIRGIATAIGLDVSNLVRGSTLNASGTATDLLISMTKAVGGTTYLCGGGSEVYLEEEKFSQAGVELLYQDFHHPIYPQKNTREFVMGLSIIDALMNCGLKGTWDLISKKEVYHGGNSIG